MNQKVKIYHAKNATSLKWVFYLTMIFTGLGFALDIPRSFAEGETIPTFLNASHIIYSLVLLPFILLRKIRIYYASLLIIYAELLVVILSMISFMLNDGLTLGIFSSYVVLGVLYIGSISLLSSPKHTVIYGSTLSTFVLLTSLSYQFEANFIFAPVYALILYSFTLGMYIF